MRLLRSPLEFLICVILVLLTSTVFSQVIARYVLHAPLSWSEELARFLLMWLSMLSAAYAFKVKSHFALRILVNRISPKFQFNISILVHSIVTIFFVSLTYFGVIFLIGVSGHIAPALQIPMEIPYSSIVVGSALIVWESLKSIWLTLKQGKTSAREPFGVNSK
ncbi:MAG: TRAP transporter small permease [Bacteroidetes bacterium]|nr:TRAP transporter small permease [Bacteroidota bacterium]